MKGIVLSLGIPKKGRFHLPDFRFLFRRYGILIAFAGVLLTGLALGAVYAQNADGRTLRSLDLLFTTNLNARLSQGVFGTFCACFASDFLFLFSIYLLGVAAWGIPFILLIVGFKGFGTGVTAGYLCLSHSLAGAGFYLLVLLPGTFLFCTALIRFSGVAFGFSRQMFRRSLSKSQTASSPRQELLSYSSRFFSALALTFIAALLDTLLWTLFAGTFNF